MKAKEFLRLVGEMLTVQQDYFAARRKGEPKPRQTELLIKSKELEKRVWAVVKTGELEPDEPQPTVHVYTTEHFQEQLRLINEDDIQNQLDFVAIRRPNEPEQKPLFTDGEK